MGGLAQAHGFRKAGGGNNMVGSDFAAVVEPEQRRPPLLLNDLRDATFHPTLAAGLAVLVEQHADDHAHAIEGPGEALEVEGLEHDDELAELHVPFLRAAVIHYR